MRRFLSLFGREISSIDHAAYILAASSLSSQILALFRDRLLASSFGAGFNLDLYYSAFRIPDMVFATVGSLVSASVLLPTIASKLSSEKDDLKSFINSIFSFYTIVILVISSILFLVSPNILKIIFPKIIGSDFGLLVTLTRILLLSPIFLGLSNLFSSIVQINNRFFISALSPVLYNIGIIVGIIFLFPIFGLKGLVFGVVFGAFMHFMVQVPFVVKSNLFPKLQLSFSHSIKKVLSISIPRTVTVSSAEISELFLISFASFLSVGAISIFNLSFNLQSVPFSIIGVSYAVAVFPTLSKMFGSGKKIEFFEKILKTSNHIIFWSIPATFLIFLSKFELVSILLGSGKFDDNSIILTASAFSIFSLSLVFQNLTLVFMRSFYAQGKTARPLFISIFGALLIISSSYIFSYFFDKSFIFRDLIVNTFNLPSYDGIKVLTLALGYSFGTTITSIIYILFISFDYKKFFQKIVGSIFVIYLVSQITFIITKYLLSIFNFTNTFFGFSLKILSSTFLFIALEILIMAIIKNNEFVEIKNSIFSRFKKNEIVSSGEL